MANYQASLHASLQQKGDAFRGLKLRVYTSVSTLYASESLQCLNGCRRHLWTSSFASPWGTGFRFTYFASIKPPASCMPPVSGGSSCYAGSLVGVAVAERFCHKCARSVSVTPKTVRVTPQTLGYVATVYKYSLAVSLQLLAPTPFDASSAAAQLLDSSVLDVRICFAG